MTTSAACLIPARKSASSGGAADQHVILGENQLAIDDLPPEDARPEGFGVDGGRRVDLAARCQYGALP